MKKATGTDNQTSLVSQTPPEFGFSPSSPLIEPEIIQIISIASPTGELSAT
ncbi:hypothetical protein F511_27190 [Dorcoceras hygrometricum]|uniref:Uncharacterized protein n=1 Tax=Dorcoceras hygrometricum TaxID=472368 RepID=A0A2Z7CET7_9LAMI|nr:hypothetical protein F511_27190 [Dorcoceras hygrometricum]